MYKAYMKITSVMAKVLTAMAVIAISIMVIACFAQVVIRNMGRSAPWVEEMARYAQVWITFLGGAVAYKHGSLAAIDFLKTKLNGKSVAILDLIILALCVVFFCYGVSGGIVLASKMARQTTAALKISKAFVYGALPTGCAFMLLFSIEHFFNSVRVLAGKKEDK